MANSPDPAEVKKQLEAIAGRTIEISPEQIKLFSFPVGAHDVTDGTVEWENIFGFKSCIASSLLDASGAVTTGTAGNVTFQQRHMSAPGPFLGGAGPFGRHGANPHESDAFPRHGDSCNCGRRNRRSSHSLRLGRQGQSGA